jgi:hypothetical protein
MKVLEKQIPKAFLDMNRKALEVGAELVKDIQVY